MFRENITVPVEGSDSVSPQSRWKSHTAHTHTQELFYDSSLHTTLHGTCGNCHRFVFPNLSCNVISIMAPLAMWQEAESAMTVAPITAYQCYWGEVLNAKWLNTLLKRGGGGTSRRGCVWKFSVTKFENILAMISVHQITKTLFCYRVSSAHPRLASVKKLLTIHKRLST